MKIICRICFEEFEQDNLFKCKYIICQKCFSQFDIRWKKIKFNKISTLIIYHYNEFFKSNLYLFKGCYDYQMKDIFLDRFINELKLRYIGYKIVCVPSNDEDNLIRGFNHVKEIFLSLNKKFIDCLYKKSSFKQSNRNKSQRGNVIKEIGIKDGELIRNQKILLVDDVITTGNTIKTCSDLILKFNPKKLKILILSKNFENNEK